MSSVSGPSVDEEQSSLNKLPKVKVFLKKNKNGMSKDFSYEDLALNSVKVSKIGFPKTFIKRKALKKDTLQQMLDISEKDHQINGKKRASITKIFPYSPSKVAQKNSETPNIAKKSVYNMENISSQLFDTEIRYPIKQFSSDSNDTTRNNNTEAHSNPPNTNNITKTEFKINKNRYTHQTSSNSNNAEPEENPSKTVPKFRKNFGDSPDSSHFRVA